MQLDLITKQDLYDLKNEILSEIKTIIHPTSHEKKWLKSGEVRDLLGCSPGTLQSLRVSGKLPFSKIRGTIYYKLADVHALLNGKRNA